MTTIFSLQNNIFKELAIFNLEELRQTPEFENTMIWVDLSNPSAEEETVVLSKIFEFHPLAMEDCRKPKREPNSGGHHPKVEEYENHLFVIFNPVDIPVESVRIDTPEHQRSKKNQQKIVDIIFPTSQISTFLGENFIVTHHYQTLSAITSTQEMCLKNPHILGRGSDYIYHLIADEIVDKYTPILEYFDDAVENLETRVLNKPDDESLSRILSLKKAIQRLRRIALYQREILNRLSRGEFKLISLEETLYYRNVYDHLVRVVDITESYRDVITGMMDVYLSVASNRLNVVMKFLTILSTTFLPLTLITGIYGMNFDNMPELHTAHGYFVIWCVLISVAGVMLYIFKRKGWLE